MGKLQDLTGEKFGRLTVIKRDYSANNQTKWICKCECGKEKSVLASNLKRGLTKSCGCLSAEQAHERTFKDLTGQKFGKLFVLKRTKDRVNKKGVHSVRYECKCDCGNLANVSAANLKNGHIKSCGCYNREIGRNRLEDLSNQVFGLLTVLYRADNDNEHTMWVCKCKCGNITTVGATHLKQRLTKSCGCIKSSGEYNVNQYLNLNNIEYKTQVKYDDLIGVGDGNLSYDFYLPKFNLLIECQGRQHYEPISIYGGEKQFQIQKEHDKRKKEYAQSNGYDFIEIPYWEYDNIEDILNRELEVV